MERVGGVHWISGGRGCRLERRGVVGGFHRRAKVSRDMGLMGSCEVNGIQMEKRSKWGHWK